MPSGPFFPTSIAPDTSGNVFWGASVAGGATNFNRETGIGVAASIGADASVDLRFVAPSIPSGEALRLVLIAKAAATSGSAIVRPQWAAVNANGGSPNSATLASEGDFSLTWGATDSNLYKQLQIVLDATTAPTPGQILLIKLTFESTGWTLAQPSVWQCWIETA